MRVLTYRVLLRPEPEGGYTATVPSLPGCVTYGADLVEVKAMVHDAIEAYLESRRAHGEEVPDDAGVLEETVAIAVA
jgi:antitoxin HicB